MALRCLREKLSEKRPETDREILTRSQKFDLQVSDSSAMPATKSQRYRIDLPSHIAECDVNYHRMQKLFPGMRLEDKKSFEILFSEQAYRVTLEVLDRGPYTTTIRIRQSEKIDRWVVIPTISVRVYHDAKSAEVIRVGDQEVFHGVYEYPNRNMRQPDEKEQINKFLGEVLLLCIENGMGSELFAKV